MGSGENDGAPLCTLCCRHGDNSRCPRGPNHAALSRRHALTVSPLVNPPPAGSAVRERLVSRGPPRYRSEAGRRCARGRRWSAVVRDDGGGHAQDRSRDVAVRLTTTPRASDFAKPCVTLESQTAWMLEPGQCARSVSGLRCAGGGSTCGGVTTAARDASGHPGTAMRPEVPRRRYRYRVNSRAV
jgi:hypothetical protein